MSYFATCSTAHVLHVNRLHYVCHWKNKPKNMCSHYSMGEWGLKVKMVYTRTREQWGSIHICVFLNAWQTTQKMCTLPCVSETLQMCIVLVLPLHVTGASSAANTSKTVVMHHALLQKKFWSTSGVIVACRAAHSSEWAALCVTSKNIPKQKHVGM